MQTNILKKERRPISFYIALILGCLLLAIISFNTWLWLTDRVNLTIVSLDDLSTTEYEVSVKLNLIEVR